MEEGYGKEKIRNVQISVSLFLAICSLVKAFQKCALLTNKHGIIMTRNIFVLTANNYIHTMLEGCVV